MKTLSETFAIVNHLFIVGNASTSQPEEDNINKLIDLFIESIEKYANGNNVSKDNMTLCIIKAK